MRGDRAIAQHRFGLCFNTCADRHLGIGAPHVRYFTGPTGRSDALLRAGFLAAAARPRHAWWPIFSTGAGWTKPCVWDWEPYCSGLYARMARSVTKLCGRGTKAIFLVYRTVPTSPRPAGLSTLMMARSTAQMPSLRRMMPRIEGGVSEVLC